MSPRNASVAFNAPDMCEANNSSTSNAHLQLAPTTLTALPDEILYLIVEHIIDDDRLSNGCIVVESVAARSLIALRRSCHTFLSLVEQALQCSLKLHVGDISAISEDPALTAFMSIHRSTVQFPLLSHVTNLELNKVLVTERVLGNLAAAAPSLAVLKLAFCHLTCDERAAPVVFSVLSELVIDSNAIDLNDLVRALRVPQIKQMNVVFHRSGAPSTLPRLWPSVSTVMLTSRHKVPLDAAVLDALPRLETLNLDTMDVDWAGGIVPELKSLTTLTTNTVCLRRLAQNPATLAGLIELNVTGILDAVPDPAFATLQRFRATTMNVRVFVTLARMPKLATVSVDCITADWAMNGLTLVYRQGNPIWRVFPQVERRSTVPAITNRLVVRVERVVDADKAARQIAAVAQSTAKYAEALPMPLDVVVAPDLNVHVVSRIGAMIEGLPAKSVAGRIVVGGDHEVLPNGQS
ncbi:hypothetical protein GGF31_007069 [Allomyces arbusculus]|nr:hypothetical protein GGF31_007069 [Allomyces arbusculus]